MILITLQELAHAVSQLPNCHNYQADYIEVQNSLTRKQQAQEYERPAYLRFHRVAIVEAFHHIEYRWALSMPADVLIS